MFVSHWSSASVDTKYLKSQNSGIEESCDFMNGSVSLYISSLPSLVAIDIVAKEKISFYFVI